MTETEPEPEPEDIHNLKGRTPEWMESGRRTESGVPHALLDGKIRGTRGNRLRFARKMAERKAKREQLQREQERELWRKKKQEYKQRAIPLIKRPALTEIQNKFGARRIG